MAPAPPYCCVVKVAKSARFSVSCGNDLPCSPFCPPAVYMVYASMKSVEIVTEDPLGITGGVAGQKAV